MDNYIGRQAAIDAINEYMAGKRCDTDGTMMARLINELVIKKLPSAQPEIIRCKDCKHRDPEDKKCDCGHDIQWQLPRQDDWFCADAERREATE